MSEGKERKPSLLRNFLSSIGGNSKTREQKTQDKTAKCDALVRERWGPPGSPTSEMVSQYWQSTRMEYHWNLLRVHHPRIFQQYLWEGYMEPIPLKLVENGKLSMVYPEPSYWKTPAQKRLYYTLNNSLMPDGTKHPIIQPLNAKRDMNLIIQRGNERKARQVHLDAHKLSAYQSSGDVFHSDKEIQSHQYSPQVPNTINAARKSALQNLAEDILYNKQHLETMLLIDISTFTTLNPHLGIKTPDSTRRKHDQPPSISLIQHLVHRSLHHMIPRAQLTHPSQTGIPTITFSTTAEHIGSLTSQTFHQDWTSRIKPAGGPETHLMPAWRTIKQTFFTQLQTSHNHGRYDNKFGWQPTPGMPKLSLLIFLATQPSDMEEFELELLGLTWVNITIVLIGMEDCPFHHAHAAEWERVARFNPNIGVVSVEGRVCERWVVEEVLGSVFPLGAPKGMEILRGEFDLVRGDA